MSGTTQKRFSGKKLHIKLLRVLIFSGFVLLAITLMLQIANIVLPALEEETIRPLLGHPSNAFRINKETIFPFLLAPLLLEVVAYLYFKRYFARNNISAMDHISYFRKHSHTVFGRRFFMVFSSAAILLSVVLAGMCDAIRSVGEAWFGTVTVVGVCALLYFSAKLMRHTRRQYFSHRNSIANKEDQQ